MRELFRNQSVGLSDLDAIAAKIVGQLSNYSCVYLHGPMGAGKTTLCQLILHQLGVTQAVTSPTYNIVHQYKHKHHSFYHLDLYRLQDAEEIEFLGLDFARRKDTKWFIEWPERGLGFLPQATHHLTLLHVEPYRDDRRDLLFAREG